MIQITPPCETCGHTRTLHERQDEPNPAFPCLFDCCECQRYVATEPVYVWVHEGSA